MIVFISFELQKCNSFNGMESILCQPSLSQYCNKGRKLFDWLRCLLNFDSLYATATTNVMIYCNNRMLLADAFRNKQVYTVGSLLTSYNNDEVGPMVEPRIEAH